MDNQRCSKCGGEMDEGRVSTTDGLHYVSNRQKGMLKTVTKVDRARVCLHCGYIELYLDADTLRKRVQ